MCCSGDSAHLNFQFSKSVGPYNLSFSLHGLSTETRRLARSERLSNSPTRLEPKVFAADSLSTKVSS